MRYTCRQWNLIKRDSFNNNCKNCGLHFLDFWSVDHWMRCKSSQLLPTGIKSCVYVKGVLALFSVCQLPSSFYLWFVWLFTKHLLFFPGLLSGLGATVGSLLTVLLLTLGRFGAEACPVTEGLGQMEGVKAQASALGSLGYGKKVRVPSHPSFYLLVQIRYSRFWILFLPLNTMWPWMCYLKFLSLSFLFWKHTLLYHNKD